MFLVYRRTYRIIVLISKTTIFFFLLAALTDFIHPYISRSLQKLTDMCIYFSRQLYCWNYTVARFFAALCCLAYHGQQRLPRQTLDAIYPQKANWLPLNYAYANAS